MCAFRTVDGYQAVGVTYRDVFGIYDIDSAGVIEGYGIDMLILGIYLEVVSFDCNGRNGLVYCNIDRCALTIGISRYLVDRRGLSRYSIGVSFLIESFQCRSCDDDGVELGVVDDLDVVNGKRVVGRTAGFGIGRERSQHILFSLGNGRSGVGERRTETGPFAAFWNQDCGVSYHVGTVGGQFRILVLEFVVQDKASSTVFTSSRNEFGIEAYRVGSPFEKEVVSFIVEVGKIIVFCGVFGSHATHIDGSCGQISIGFFTKNIFRI